MNTFKIRRQGNQLHVYVTVDGIMIAHRVFNVGAYAGRICRDHYMTGLRLLGFYNEVNGQVY